MLYLITILRQNETHTEELMAVALWQITHPVNESVLFPTKHPIVWNLSEIGLQAQFQFLRFRTQWWFESQDADAIKQIEDPVRES